jgi:DNA polymerase
LKNELLELTRQLRLRVLQSHESDFAFGSSTDCTRVQSVDKPRPAAPSGGLSPLQVLAEEVSACRACPLGETRLKPVFGVGSPEAEVMFVGEGPGFEEDHKGEPFVGKSGQLLDNIMRSIGLSRETVYIANIVKCHPMVEPDPEKRGNDRPPTPEEIAACRRFLDEQIRLIRPRVIVTLGAVPARVLLETTEGITKLRGQWRRYTPEGGKPVAVLPTFHPAALLRDESLKKFVWTDMKSLRARLSEPEETP